MNNLGTHSESPAPCCPWLNRAALRYWAFHVCVSAAPSFAFGYTIAPRPERLCGMALGVAFFIVLYTLAARWTYPSEASPELWRRAMRLATWIRTSWALFTIPASILGGALLFAPDMVAGMVAHGLVENLSGLESGVRNRASTELPAGFWMGNMGSVVPTFLVTVIEGFILSGVLFLIALVCLSVLTLRTRLTKARLCSPETCDAASQPPTN